MTLAWAGQIAKCYSCQPMFFRNQTSGKLSKQRVQHICQHQIQRYLRPKYLRLPRLLIQLRCQCLPRLLIQLRCQRLLLQICQRQCQQISQRLLLQISQRLLLPKCQPKIHHLSVRHTLIKLTTCLLSVLDPTAKDVLDKEKCLQALAALRHAKWFQARANHTTSCVIVIRILRDLCNNNPVFKPLSGWVVELLCEKSLSSAPHPLGPGEAFRRVMEALASGIVLGGGVGILDPCEKEKTDAAASLTLQERA